MPWGLLTASTSARLFSPSGLWHGTPTKWQQSKLRIWHQIGHELWKPGFFISSELSFTFSMQWRAEVFIFLHCVMDRLTNNKVLIRYVKRNKYSCNFNNILSVSKVNAYINKYFGEELCVETLWCLIEPKTAKLVVVLFFFSHLTLSVFSPHG